MNLQSSKLGIDMKVRYRDWANILYFGGLVHGQNFQERVINNEVKLVPLIESIEKLQGVQLKKVKPLFQSPNVGFMKKFMTDPSPEFQSFRDTAYGLSGATFPGSPATSQPVPSQTPVKLSKSPDALSGAPTQPATPNKATESQAKLLQRFADDFKAENWNKDLIHKFGLPAKSSVVAQNIRDARAIGKPVKKSTSAQKAALQKFADNPKPPTAGYQLNLIEKYGLPPRTQPRTAPPATPATPRDGVAAGSGLKHTGLKTVKQIISRTENLIQAANLGNKSTEVRNELDTLLAVLIDRKEVRPEFRTKLMKKLF